MTAISSFLPGTFSSRIPERRTSRESRNVAYKLTRNKSQLGMMRRVDSNRTTADVQHYLDKLALAGGSSPDEAVVRALLARSVDRLHRLCAGLLYRHYPRLTRGPLNLNPDEM